MREMILEILTDVKPTVDFSTAEKLFTDGVLDSFDIIMLISELRDAFDVAFAPQDLTPENFDSVDSIAAMVTAKKAN